jgi:hypothetical protein
MKEKLLLKIVIAEETEEGFNVHTDCPIKTINDGLILTNVFCDIMKHQPYFAAAVKTALMKFRLDMAEKQLEEAKEEAEEELQDTQKDFTIKVKPNQTQS